MYGLCAARRLQYPRSFVVRQMRAPVVRNRTIHPDSRAEALAEAIPEACIRIKTTPCGDGLCMKCYEFHVQQQAYVDKKHSITALSSDWVISVDTIAVDSGV